MRPISHADGSYRVWRLCELFPCLACCFDNGLIMVEDAYPSAEGRLALRGEDLDRYRKSGSMVVSTC